MRVQMIIPDDLLKKVDQRAKALNLTRTAYVVMSLSMKIQQDELTEVLPQMQKFLSDHSEDEKGQ